MSKSVLILVLITVLAGCGDGGHQDQQARDTQRREAAQAQTEAQSREIAVLTQVQAERTRREFWQGLACFAGAWSVVLLIIGVAMGSATIPKEKGGPDASNP